jgi:hypothetical protein
MVGLVAASAGAAAADDAARKPVGQGGRTIVSTAVSGGEAILVAEGPRVRFEQHAGQGGMWFRIESGGDVVRVRLTSSAASVARGNREVTLARHSVGPAAWSQVARLVDRSPAARALDAMVRELTPSADESIRGLELAAATLRALQGDAAPAQALARRLSAPRSDRHLVRAMAGADAGVNNCYDEWLRDTSRFLEEYFACEEAMRWLPLGGSLSCTYEWLFKVTIANSILAMCVAS